MRSIGSPQATPSPLLVSRTASALLAALALLSPAGLRAQAGTGAVWTDFGPWSSDGVLFEISKVQDGDLSAYGVAADPQGRLLTLTEWQDATFDLNLDCSVVRHLANARSLDMDFTGELEAARRIALDLGGADDDHCTAIAADPFARPVIAGYAGTSGPDAAFVVRLKAADGSYDTTFSSDGRFTLENLPGFAGDETGFENVATYADRRILACGWVTRGAERNMLVVRLLATGALDPGFNGVGYREIDFNGGGADDDVCERALILPDERIVLAGTAHTTIPGDTGIGLVRLNADGSSDTSFSGDGKVAIDDASALTSPTVVDVGYDTTRQRLVVAATSTGGAAAASGLLVAVTDAGALDAGFNGSGRRSLRFSDFGTLGHAREFGATHLKRLLMRPDGSFYLAGTHDNSDSDAATYGASDVALARLRPDGTDDTGSNGFSVDGVAFFAYAGMGHRQVSDEEAQRIGDNLEDAILYHGNVLLLSETNRHPQGTWDDVTWDLGPIAPVLAGIVTDRIWSQDWEPEGLPQPTTPFPLIPVPAGYGRYCSVLDPVSGISGLLAQGPTSDPCQEFLDQNPDLLVERAGLYSLAGANNVLASCADGYIGLHPGSGTAPFEAASATAAGRADCVFTASPAALPVFDRPYTGAHTEATAQSFNHDVFYHPLDVTEFGHSPKPNHPLAHYVDLNGAQMCDDNNGHNGNPAIGGVDEAASDIGIGVDRIVRAVAPGRVENAVPRYLLFLAPVGNDPYQREVHIRHTIGSGRYAESFTTYYAHMSDTRVRRGDAVAAGTELGRVGTTGSSGGPHLHLAVFRHRNLSWRSSWEFSWGELYYDQDKELAAIDPWGWRGPAGLDPWAWRFRASDEPWPDLAGSWSLDLWKPGEAPTME